MKINDKNLIAFSTSKTPVDREGWLMKRGEVNKSFQKRWFVLKGNLLFYFEKKTEKEPVGVIILEGCTIELAENEELFAFKVLFHGAGNRTYVLCADSQENMEDWMKALACASYDYMKLMVAELQRQLNEIAEAEKQAKSGIFKPLLAGGLPVNRSDSCLCSHQGAGRNQRFNPFDRWKFDTGAKDGVANEAACSEGAVASRSRKYGFLELHKQYGQKFRKLIDDRRKQQEIQDMNGMLIDLQ